jgi:LPXTG-motif cell wall-anchored protein
MADERGGIMTTNPGHTPTHRGERVLRRRSTLLVAATIFVAVLSTASTAATARTLPAGSDDVATGEPPVATIPNYVVTTTTPERSLDVSAFAPECVLDVPYIKFTIVPIGFTSSGPATLTFFDANGNFVEKVVSPTLSGRIIYPGAVAGPDGQGLDWPGWKRADDGSWIPDRSDEILRQGLTVQVEVNPTATAKVAYPPADSPCANPPRTTPPAPPLPRTGGGVSGPLIIGGAALLAGLTMVGAARRRRRSRHPLPS